MSSPFFKTSRVVVALLIATLPAPALAADGVFALELNDSAEVEGGCRLTFLAINGTSSAVEKASYEVFTFAKEGRVSQSLVFQFGGFRPGKTKVFQFDLPGQPCTDISRLLLNDATECTVDGAPSSLCIDGVETRNLTTIEFGY